eukprot:3571590-Prymnesium_polylepis.1
MIGTRTGQHLPVPIPLTIPLTLTLALTLPLTLAQKRVGLEEETIDQDVKTRWRTAHNMGDQLVYNKTAVLEMDKNPKYKEAGE